MNYLFHKKILDAAVANKYSFAVCKLPKNEIIKTYIAGEAPLEEVVKTRINRCFLLSGFDNGHHAWMLKPTLYFENEKLVGEEDHGFYLRLMNHSSIQKNERLYFPSVKRNNPAGKKEYTGLVEKAIGAIKKKEFQKVVVARSAGIKLQNNFDPLKYFFTLCDNYHNAFIYFFSSPRIGTWIGASPENLVSVENDTLKTVALAGTLDKKSLVDWSRKERQEQAYVEKFISNVFAGNGISDYRKGNVQTIAAGNLRHLQTSFSWEADAEILQKNFASFLKDLNPTPAVCGLPKKESSEFIKNNEGFERRFYSGFAGIADHHSTHLFVNLRCMELLKDEAILYAGAGITAGSDAEKEWVETENKMKTLSRFL
ncbi:MAG: isochorismate synthase [Bacteroidia bacterium]